MLHIQKKLLKNISIIILTFLLLAPPVQAHADAIIFNENIESHLHHLQILNGAHLESHHKNDTEEDKNKEHHHHCISLGISSAIITAEFKYQFKKPLQIQKKIHFHKVLNTASFLDELFQPPRV